MSDEQPQQCPECDGDVFPKTFTKMGPANEFDRKMGAACEDPECGWEDNPFDTPTITSPCRMCEEETIEDRQIKGRCIGCHRELKRQREIRQMARDMAEQEEVA